MFDFHQKRKIRSVFESRVTQVVVFIIASFILMSAFNRFLIAQDMAERRAAVESEIESLEARRESLDAEVRYLSNERGIEAEMRRQFDIAREGEQVVIILEDEPIAEPPPLPATTTKRAWYRFW